MAKEDLIPYKKGQSGNPLGNALDRHSTKPIAKRLAELLALEGDYEDVKGTVAKIKGMDAVVYSLLKKSINDGDVAAIKEVFNRVDGAVEKGADIQNNIQINQVTEIKVEFVGTENTNTE